TRTYAYGRLKTLSDFINDVTYWPNGMRNVMSHANSIADTQTITNMPRPSQLQFAQYDRCVQPTFVTQPVSVQSTAGANVTLAVIMSGTPPFTYDWWDKTNLAHVGTTASITVSPNTTAEYEVIV